MVRPRKAGSRRPTEAPRSIGGCKPLVYRWSLRPNAVDAARDASVLVRWGKRYLIARRFVPKLSRRVVTTAATLPWFEHQAPESRSGPPCDPPRPRVAQLRRRFCRVRAAVPPPLDRTPERRFWARAEGVLWAHLPIFGRDRASPTSSCAESFPASGIFSQTFQTSFRSSSMRGIEPCR